MPHQAAPAQLRFTQAGYNPADRDYLAAHDLADALLKAGEIRAFSVSRHRTQGRRIEIETEQGWNPEPLFCEHPEPDNPMRYL